MTGSPRRLESLTAAERMALEDRLRSTREFRHIVEFFRKANVGRVLLDPQALLRRPSGRAVHVVQEAFASRTFRYKPGQECAAELGLEWREDTSDFMRDALYAQVGSRIEALRREIADSWLRELLALVMQVLSHEEILEVINELECRAVMEP